MKAICAWCGADMGVRPGSPHTSTTHGICPRCSASVLASVGLKIERGQDGVARPVAISAASQSDGKGVNADRPLFPDNSCARSNERALPSRTTAAVNLVEDVA